MLALQCSLSTDIVLPLSPQTRCVQGIDEVLVYCVNDGAVMDVRSPPPLVV